MGKINFVEMVDLLRAEGFTDAEINHQISISMMEAEHDFYEDYYNDPLVQDGWHQQDIIDMYRRER